MLGLINRSYQYFLIDTFGADAWDAVAGELRLPVSGFEAMLSYDDSAFDRLIDTLKRVSLQRAIVAAR